MSVLKFHREICSDAAGLGIDDLQIIERGRHVLLAGKFRGKPITHFLSRSPSDARVRKNVRAHLRRRVREIANQDIA